MNESQHEKNLEKLADDLRKVIEHTVSNMSNLTFSRKTAVSRKTILEYEGQMRIVPMDTFNLPAYACVISFYRNEQEQSERKGCGAVVLYLEKSVAEDVLRALGHRGADMDDEESMSEAVSQLTDLLLDNFLRARRMTLIKSKAQVFENTAPIGFDFGWDQYYKHELLFHLKGRPALAVDFTLSEGFSL